LARVAAIGSLLLLSGCGFIHDERLVGRYRLVAVDDRADMSLCWSLDSGDCVGDGLPGPTVFAAGFDDKYIVAAVHPHLSQRGITQFFYVARDPANENKDSGLPYRGIKGPFSQVEYAAESTRLRLPPFTRIFDDLK
jgi:hypothetical protein